MNQQLLATFNFRDECIMLNEGVLDALGRPQQVQILIHPEKKNLLVRSCDVKSKWAIMLDPENVMQVEIGAKALLRKLRRMLGWETEQPRICKGELVLDNTAVVFRLEEAIAVDVPGHTDQEAG